MTSVPGQGALLESLERKRVLSSCCIFEEEGAWSQCGMAESVSFRTNWKQCADPPPN